MAKNLPDTDFITETGMYLATCPICKEKHEAPAIVADRTEWYRGKMLVANAVCSKPECRTHVTDDP